MTDMQQRLGHYLLKNLVELRQQKQDVSLEDIGEMFLEIAESIHPAQSAADRLIHQEIAKMAQYINDAKKEIFSISTNDKSEQAITNASMHLDEVVKATEEASHAIMDAADKIQASATGIGGEKEQQIMDAAMLIYEACNFQDITGQRINKVMKLLANIEERVNKLNELFGVQDAPQEAANSNGVTSDADLLNGPQLASQASSQADIDALFASLSGKN